MSQDINVLRADAEKAIAALQKNNIQAVFVPTAAAALAEIIKRLPPGCSVSFGGSATLRQLKIAGVLQERGYHLINPWRKELSREESMELRRRALTVDAYLTGTNAVTCDGKLVNIDGTGNRVAAMCFGPKHVIFVAGVNKIVPDVPAALARIKSTAAPQNARTLGYKTPCGATGTCNDCAAPDRMCNLTLIIEKKPRATEMTVILVGEALGF